MIRSFWGILTKQIISYIISFLTPDKFKIYSIRGFKMYLNPHESFMMKMRLLRAYERDKFNFIKNNLKRNDIFIDIGANIGDFSLYAAKRAREGKVLSFEPSADNFKMLKKSIKANNYKNIFPHQVAIGLNDDKNKLFLGNKSGLHSLIENNPNNTGAYELVRIKPLDYFFKDVENVKIIKIDVEGAEIDVLRGMNRILNTYKPFLLIDIHTKLGVTITEVSNILQKYGYNILETTSGKSTNHIEIIAT